MSVVISKESKRGCGYRKPSKGGVGIYLVGPSQLVSCGRLPFKLEACPCCGGGIKPSRSWTWIEPKSLIGPPPVPAPAACGLACMSCPMGLGMPAGQHGLIWIGEGFYKTPGDFMVEASRMGISRKLPAVPRNFVLGKTVVYLAHRKAVLVPQILSPDPLKREMAPGIFTAFKPTGIDLVIADENNVPERAQKLADRLQKAVDDGEAQGDVRLVKVIPEGEQTDLPLDVEAEVEAPMDRAEQDPQETRIP